MGQPRADHLRAPYGELDRALREAAVFDLSNVRRHVTCPACIAEIERRLAERAKGKT